MAENFKEYNSELYKKENELEIQSEDSSNNTLDSILSSCSDEKIKPNFKNSRSRDNLRYHAENNDLLNSSAHENKDFSLCTTDNDESQMDIINPDEIQMKLYKFETFSEEIYQILKQKNGCTRRKPGRLSLPEMKEVKSSAYRFLEYPRSKAPVKANSLQSVDTCSNSQENGFKSTEETYSFSPEKDSNGNPTSNNKAFARPSSPYRKRLSSDKFTINMSSNVLMRAREIINQNSMMAQKISSHEGETNKLYQDLANVNSKLKKSQDFNEQLEKHARDLENQLTEMDEKLRINKEEYDEKLKTFEKNYKNLRDQLQSVKKGDEYNSNRAQSLFDLNHEYAGNIVDLQSQLEDRDREIADIKTEKEFLIDKINNIENDLEFQFKNKYDTEIDSLIDGKKELLDSCKHLERQVKELNDQLNRMKTLKDDSISENRILSTQIHKYVEQIEELKKSVSVTHEEREQETLKLRSEMGILEENFNEMVRNHESLKEKYLINLDELERSKKSATEASKVEEKLKKELETLLAKSVEDEAVVRNFNSQLKDEVEEPSKTKDHLFDFLLKQLDEKKNHVNNFIELVSSKCETLNEVKSNWPEIDATIRKLEKECSNKEEKRDLLASSIQEMDEQAISLAANLTALEIDIKEISNKSKRKSETLRNLKAKYEELTKEVEKLSLEEVTRIKEVSDLQKKDSASREEYERCKSLLSNMNEEISVETELLETAEKKRLILEQSMYLMQEVINKLQKVIGETDDTLQSLKSALSSKEQHLESLKNKHQIVDEKNKYLKDLSSEKDEQIHLLKQSLAVKQEEITCHEQLIAASDEEKEKLMQLLSKRIELDSIKTSVVDKKEDSKDSSYCKVVQSQTKETIERSIEVSEGTEMEVSEQCEAAKTDLLEEVETCKAFNGIIDLYKLSVENKKRQVMSLENSSSAKQSEIKTLQELVISKDSEIEQLQKSIQSKDAELVALKECVKENDSEILTLKVSSELKETEIESLKSYLSNKVVEIDSLMEKSLDKNADVSTLKETLRVSEAELLSLGKHLEYGGKELEFLNMLYLEKQEEIKSLKDSVEAKNSEIKSLKESTRAVEAEIDSLNGCVSSSESEIQSLKDFKSLKEAEFKTIKNLFNGKEKELQNLNDSISCKDSEIFTLRIQLDGLEVEVAKLHEEVILKDENLKSLSRNVESKDGEIKSVTDLIDLKEKEVKSLEESYKERESKLSVLNLQLGEITGKISELSEKNLLVSKMEKFSAIMAEEKTKLEEREGELSLEISALKSDKEKLLQDIRLLKVNISLKEDASEALRVKLREEEQNKEILKSKLTKSDSKREGISKNMGSLQEHVNVLVNKLKSKDKELGAARATMKVHEEAKRTALKELEAMKTTHKELFKKFQATQFQLEKTKGLYLEVQNTNKDLKEKVESLQRKSSLIPQDKNLFGSQNSSDSEIIPPTRVVSSTEKTNGRLTTSYRVPLSDLSTNLLHKHENNGSVKRKSVLQRPEGAKRLASNHSTGEDSNHVAQGENCRQQ